MTNQRFEFIDFIISNS